MNVKKRTAAILATAVAAAALPILMASPASADQGACQFSLIDHGYVVGPKSEAACRTGSDVGNPARWIQCYWGLTAIGVKEVDAARACNAA
ncbi:MULTISPECIES: hypothetical protein [unclassified Streptomyces]|uniref:hypothetical protein n=1 Tax=unclassified Streptomyces TaxID=2593676 RepID=UPI0004C87A17|nr:hypothetical protein [Streptomyces sp. NRRL F-2747]